MYTVRINAELPSQMPRDGRTEDAMEFILSAIESGVDERAVRKMIAMDEVELLRVCDNL